MRNECLSLLRLCSCRELVDCNLGEGGHAGFFLDSLPELCVTGVDCDGRIMDMAKRNLSRFEGRVRFVNMWADAFLAEEPKESADCVFFDLGVSMFHFKASGRGFSFSKDEKLDMRLCESDRLTAYEVVNRYDEARLARIIWENSDERKARAIAQKIVFERGKARIATSAQLAGIVRSAFGSYGLRYRGKDVATRTFQAIRIEVNRERERLERELDLALAVVRRGGMVIVISFNSLEDRIVKMRFRRAAAEGGYSILTRKPIVPGQDEKDSNPASTSAKLRAVRRNG